MSKRNQRKKYFIDKEFQSKFIFEFCGMIILSSIVMGTLLFLYLHFRGTVTTAFVNSRLSIISTSDYIFPILTGGGIICLFLISVATGIIALYLSHRVSGPLYRIGKGVTEIGDGNLDVNITLRAKDVPQKTARDLNTMTESLKIHIVEIMARSESLSNQIQALSDICLKEPSLTAEIKGEMKTLAEKKEELDKAIGYFKV